jgi:hypothetical protein
MRFVFGIAAAVIICAGWAICPASLREEVTRSVTPDAETVEEMRAGAEVILAALTVQAPDLDEDERAGH